MRIGVLIRVIIISLWLSATAWLMRYEVFPHRFGRATAGYRDLFQRGPVIMDSWMRILFKDKQIGYTHTRFDTQDRNPLEPYIVQNRTVLELQVLGTPQTISTYVTAVLDALYNLQRFDVHLRASSYQARIEARRTAGDIFQGRLLTPSGERPFSIQVPNDSLLYSPALDLAMAQLKRNESLTFRTIDPLSMGSYEVRVVAKGDSTLEWSNGSTNARLFEIQFQTLRFHAWVDSEGRLLRQETPMGWVLEASTPEEALNWVRGKDAPDLVRALAVSTDRPLTNPRTASELVIRFQEWPADLPLLENERQRVLRHEAGSMEVLVRRGQLPLITSSTSVAEPPPSVLQSSEFIEADDPEIGDLARSITADSSDDLSRVLALYDWVFRSLEKVPSVGLPSAKDTLRSRKGDCNEHTYLFVALARALGIPADVVVGLVYNEDGFYYHAWPVVWINGVEWELDPTLGQTEIDATHVAVVRGSLSAQVRLVSLMGAVRAVIVREGT